MTAADEDYTFTCEHCSTPFSYFAQYKSHGVNCDYSPSTSNNVNNNREENEEKKLHYNCSYCKGRFENFADFLSHFKFTKKKHKSCLDTQKTRLGSNDVCICVLCGFSAKRSNLLDHLHAEHEKFLKNRREKLSSIFKFCPMCHISEPSLEKNSDRPFQSPMDFLHHVSTFHPAAIFLTSRKKSESEKPDSRDKLVACPSCGMYFLDNELEQHISDLHGEKCVKFEGQEPGNYFQNFNICQEIAAKKRRISNFDVENDENLIKKRLTNNRLLYNILNEQAPKVRWRTSIVRRRLAENEIYRSILRENGEKLVTDDDEKAKNASPSANEDRPNFDEPNFKCTFCYAEFKSKATLNSHREIIHPMGVPLKLFLNRANCSPSTYRSMLSYFYRQIADGKSSNLGHFRSRCQPPPTTTTQNSTPTVRPTFPSANATTVRCQTANPTLQKSPTVAVDSSVSRQNLTPAAAAVRPTFPPADVNESIVRQRVNGRPVAVEFPLSSVEQNGNSRIWSNIQQRRNSNELISNFGRTSPPPSPPPTFRKVFESDVNANGRRFVVMKRAPTFKPNRLAAGIRITATAPPSNFPTPPPPPQQPPAATTTNRILKIGPNRAEIIVRKPAATAPLAATAPPAESSSSLNNSTNTPKNRNSLPDATLSYPMSSFSSKNPIIISIRCQTANLTSQKSPTVAVDSSVSRQNLTPAAAAVRPTFPPADVNVRCQTANLTSQKSPTVAVDSSVSRQNLTPAAAAVRPTFPPADVNESIVRQRVNGRPVAVEFPLSSVEQNGNSRIWSNIQQRRNSNELMSNFGRTSPPPSPPPTFRKVFESDVNANGRRFVVMKRAPTFKPNRLAAGIRITATAPPSNFPTPPPPSNFPTPPPPQQPPAATTTNRILKIGPNRAEIIVRKPAATAPLAATAPPAESSSSLNISTNTPKNRNSLPDATLSYPMSSFSSKNPIIISKSGNGSIILNVPRQPPTSFSTKIAQGNKKIGDDIIIE